MYKKILVPLDGSEVAESALEHLKAVAIGCNVPETVLLTVIEPVQTGHVYGVSDKWLHDIQKKARVAAENYITSVADSLGKEGVTAKTAIVQGKPADTILDYAIDNQVDLIIMCTHGRSGVSRWTFGSVADRVIRYSTVPVLIVRPRSGS